MGAANWFCSARRAHPPGPSEQTPTSITRDHLVALDRGSRSARVRASFSRIDCTHMPNRRLRDAAQEQIGQNENELSMYGYRATTIGVKRSENNPGSRQRRAAEG